MRWLTKYALPVRECSCSQPEGRGSAVVVLSVLRSMASAIGMRTFLDSVVCAILVSCKNFQGLILTSF